MKHNINAKHVFFVVADSLRYDTAKSEMPFLTELAAEGVVVDNCYAPGAETPSSMPAIMQSRLPIEHDGYGLSLPPFPPTIAEWLSDAGVATAGYHSNSYTTADAGFSRGFDDFRDLSGLGDGGTSSNNDSGQENSHRTVDSTLRERARDVTGSLGVRSLAERAIEPFKRRGYIDSDPRADGEELFAASQEWLSDRRSERTFTWFQLMDTHLPYLPPKEFRPDYLTAFSSLYDLWQALITRPAELSEEEIKSLRDLYRAEARHVDQLISQFVDYLKETGKWKSTALVITADHGELFGDRVVPGDAPVKHPNYLCEEITHVPLIIGGGGVETSAKIENLASGLDLAPTIAAMYGIDPSTEWRGEVIGSDAFTEREEVISAVSHLRENGVSVDPLALHVAVRTETRALLWWRQKFDAEYYIRSGDSEKQDHEPETGEYELLRETATEMKSKVDEVRKEGGNSGGEVSERLKNLGYVE